MHFQVGKEATLNITEHFIKKTKNIFRIVVKEIAKYPSQSWQKLEWNVGDGKRTIS